MLFTPPQRRMTWTFCLVLCTCALSTRAQTVNSVNETDGSIVWGELAPDTPYKTTDFTADDGGLDPYYALAVSFIDSSLPETLPIAKVQDILNGKASFGDSWQDLTIQFLGFAICLVIGFLFIIIFPIVACCFCCCRCCNKCGGKRQQHQGPNDKCKRIVFAGVLTILSLFVITGAACVYVSSNQLHSNLNSVNSSLSDAVDDFTTFVDNIDKQFTRLGDTNFKFMSVVLQNYVGNASSEVSADIITAINNAVNIDAPLQAISALSATANTEVAQLESQVAKLQTERDNAKTQLVALNSGCSSCLNSEIAYLTGMDAVLNTLGNEISTFSGQVSTDVFQSMKTALNTSIGTEVTSHTGNIDVAKKLNKIYDEQIKGMLDKVADLKTNLNTESSTYMTKIDDYLKVVKPYDTYRWYAGVGLASILALIAVLMLLGVILGACDGSARVKPTERGSGSNCGGLFLMSAVGLVFICGALLMLLCTLVYIPGSLTERYVCQSFDHPERLEQYTDSLDLGLDLSNITFNINGESVSTSLSALMSDCQQGQTLYTALNLSGVVDTALNLIDDFKKKNLDSINNINASSAADAANGKVNTDGDIAALEGTVDSINTVKKSVTNLKTNVEFEKNKTDALQPGAGVHYDPMITTLTDMVNTCDSLKTTAAAIAASASALKTSGLPEAKTKLNDPTFMSKLISNVTSNFVNTIFGFVDSYISDLRTKLSTDIAKCTPFYSITNAILGETFCHGIIAPLNGFWLALGWCLLFFMPSLIIGVKLAKHYRTMLYDDQYDLSTESKHPPPYYVDSSTAPAKTSLFPPINGPNNKVAPF